MVFGARMQRASLVEQFWSDVRFALNKQKLLDPPDEPLLDAPTRRAFERRLQGTKVYVEYGSGGATLLAARQAELVVSVESDGYYRSLVERKLKSLGAKARTVLLHGKIGPTTAWGAPILHVGPYAGSGWRYVSAPWAHLESEGAAADLVLVDGRYRVACALAAMLHPLGAKATFIVDDWERAAHRPLYAHVEILDRPGRSAVVRRSPRLDEAAARETLRNSLHDWR
jgi:hypothetical protein